MKPHYRVTLMEEERQELEALTKTAKTDAKRFLYARSLLLCDAGPQGPAWTVADTAEAMGVTPRTIEHLKKRFVEEGLAAGRQQIATTACESGILQYATKDAEAAFVQIMSLADFADYEVVVETAPVNDCNIVVE